MNCSLPQARSLQWQVHGLTIAGLSWGEPGDKPLLALHGWMDNAASFSMLAPLLTGFHVVALDLTGHGQSDRRSADASYQIWDDLPEILGVLEALGWDEFNLLGHSRGAIIATLLASACPERVKRLVLLDAVSPRAIEPEEFARQMRQALQDKQRLLTRDNRLFATVDDAVASRQARGLSAAAARLLVERNLQACSGGHTWTTDPRLHGASAVKLTATQNQVVLQGLTMPTLLLMARNVSERHPEIAANAQRDIADLEIAQVSGGHHFHMEADVASVAGRITDFLKRSEAQEAT